MATGNPEKVHFRAVIAGLEFDFSFGGLHAAKKNLTNRSGFDIDSDDQSYYPMLMILFDLQSRNIPDKTLLPKIKAKRIEYKKLYQQTGKLEYLMLSNAYKVDINILFGAQGDPNSPLYDLGNQRRICVFGQLYLVDLIEKIEKHIDYIDQGNTDGVIYHIHSMEQYQAIRAEIDKYEKRTGLVIEDKIGTALIQRDVNNYIYVVDGKLETHGGTVKFNRSKNGNFKVVVDAVTQFLANGIPLEKTICDPERPLMDYQYIASAGKSYHGIYHQFRGEYVPVQHVNRVFAVTDAKYGQIFKRKIDKTTYEKLALVPDRSRIINKNILKYQAKHLKDLDYQWYLDLAQKRVDEFLNGKKGAK